MFIFNNINRNINEKDVVKMIDEINDYYENKLLESVDDLIKWLDKYSNEPAPWNSNEVNSIKDVPPLVWKHDYSPVIGSGVKIKYNSEGSIISFKPTEEGKEFIEKLIADNEKEGKRNE